MTDETHQQAGDDKPALTLLDAFFVLLSASTIIAFIIWLASVVVGKPLELNLPSFLERAISGVWVWLVSAAGSFLLWLFRRNSGARFLPWTLAVALLLLAGIFVSTRLFTVEGPEFSVSEFDVNRRTPVCIGPSTNPALVPIEIQDGLFNLSLLRVARASSSTELQSQSVHRTEFLNDGWYNNCRSWVADQMPAWVAIDLGAVYEISGVNMGSEHQRMHNDRAATQFEIEVATPSQLVGRWTSVYKHNGAPVRDTTELRFPPVPARYVRVRIAASEGGPVRIDELEVVGKKLSRRKKG